MRTPEAGKDAKRLAAFAEALSLGVQPRTSHELEHGRDALVARIAGERPPRRRLVRWSLVVAATGIALVAGLRLFSLSRTPSVSTARRPGLTYQVEGGRILEGGYLHELGHGGVKVLFNEGSQFMLLPGARGRVVALGDEDTRLAIDHGTASVQVTPGQQRRWLVEVGPFLVTVKGTVFNISWDPANERFELGLQRGRVVVSGPISGGDIALRAGQRLVVDLARSETVISEEESERSAPSERAPVSSSSSRPAGDTSERGKGPRARAATTPSLALSAEAPRERHWATALASGQWERILAEVDKAGVDATLETASSEDLIALANAARYRRRKELARSALLAERRRFPGSRRDLDAIFLLGRVEESGEHGAAKAIGWYDEYLQHAPTGAYAGEALGRKMILVNELGASAKARSLAEDYLQRFPTGSYVGSARALLGAP